MGRKIDADKLISALYKSASFSFGEQNEFGLRMSLEGIIEVIEEQPAVEDVPASNGEWITYPVESFTGFDEYGEPHYAARKYYFHKKCGRRSAVAEKYCPRCGAKMYGEEK